MYYDRMAQQALARTGRQASPIVGINIRELRQLQRMSQKELASIVGDMDQPTIARIEAGARVVSIEEAQEIASALGATVLDLLNGVGEYGERLFYARVVRPLRELEDLISDAERVMQSLSDGSLKTLVARLGDGLAAYEDGVIDPAVLIESGQTVGEIFSHARMLVARYETFRAEFLASLGKFIGVQGADSHRERQRTEARKVVARG